MLAQLLLKWLSQVTVCYTITAGEISFMLISQAMVNECIHHDNDVLQNL